MFALLYGLRSISPHDLLPLLRSGEARAFDVNAPGSFREAHVPGAVSLDPTAFQPADLPADKASLVVFYCSNPLCRKAPNAALRAKKLGYENVRVMSAGIKGWLSARLPVESGA